MSTKNGPLVMERWKCPKCGAQVWRARLLAQLGKETVAFRHRLHRACGICPFGRITRTGKVHNGWISGATRVPALPPRKQPRIHDPATKNRNRYIRAPQGLHFDRKEARG